MLKDTDKRREKKVLAGAKLMREKKKVFHSHTNQIWKYIF